MDVRDAVTALVRRWPLDDTDGRRLVGALAAGELRDSVEVELARLVASAREQATTRRWNDDEIERLARRTRALSTSARRFLTSHVLATRPPRIVLAGDAEAARDGIADVIAACSFVLDLPELPDVGRVVPADRPEDPAQARMLEKVRALLAKAESTEFDDEAEAFTAKAQDLMARYAIDSALVETSSAPASTAVGANDAVGLRLGIDEPYASAKAMLLGQIAGANRCSAVWNDRLGISTVFGTGADLRAVEVLYTSLLVQAVAAMRRAGSHTDRSGRSRTRSFRHAFLIAFAGRIGERLHEANRAAEEAAAAESGTSFLPVLASRAEAARRARDDVFPRVATSRVTLSNAAGFHAGRAAADVAAIERGGALREG